MSTVHIPTQTPYDVIIEKGSLSNIGSLVRNVIKSGRAALITDNTVNALYADTVMESLNGAGFSPVKYSFIPGEDSKNLSTVSDIMDFLSQNELTRSDFIVALGGGITGDMAGFSASCYLRGIPFVQVPTTFLAAVDSSVGGKTGVNLPLGKNLCGAFHQPSLVVTDPDTLLSLPEHVFHDGLAETIKAGVLLDPDLFLELESGNSDLDLTKVIARAVEIKAHFVCGDEKDHGKRSLLNLGHTAAHAIESLSGYKIPHGHAVAIGMSIMSNAAEKLGLTEEPCHARIKSALIKNGLPADTDFSADELAKSALHDKKRSGDSIQIALPKRIGECFLHKIHVSELERVFELGLE